MANGKGTADPARGGGPQDAEGGRKARFAKIGSAGSQIVRDAAALLDEEMAAGVVAARNMQQRFDKERRVDPADFREALQRLQSDAHSALDLLSSQLGELRSGDNVELLSRFTRNTHDLLDVVVGMVNTTAEIAGQLAAENLPKKGEDGTKVRPARPPVVTEADVVAKPPRGRR